MPVLSTIRVRFCETDALGHVNNVSYFVYFEQGRTDLMRDIRDILGREVGVVLASIRCDFRVPCYFDEELTVRTEVKAIGRSSMTLTQTVSKAHGAIVAEGESVVVHVDPRTQRPVPIPDDLREVLGRYATDGVRCNP
ncbi:MAG: thioesterase family protein [Kyrpidia sp.]|nr:thioesterase family protein [Kyrpidia sp.]